MLTEKQIEFCQAVALGQSGTQAYAVAFKNDNMNTCRANASRMLKQPEICDKINELQGVNRQLIEAAQARNIEKMVKYEVVTAAEKLEILSQMIRGQIPVQRAIVCQGKIEIIELKPGYGDRLKAMEQMGRIDGSGKDATEGSGYGFDLKHDEARFAGNDSNENEIKREDEEINEGARGYDVDGT